MLADPAVPALPEDLSELVAVFTRLGQAPAVPVAEGANAEYGAAITVIGDRRVRLRVGKITPTKPGHFVAVWQRAADGSTIPYGAEDADALLLSVREGAGHGVFLLDRATMVDRGIVSVSGAGGKRGFRVYSPWSEVKTAQALRSQRWQCERFVDLTAPAAQVDERLRGLWARRA